MTVNIASLHASSDDFSAKLDQLLAWDTIVDSAIDQQVADILRSVREQKRPSGVGIHQSI